MRMVELFALQTNLLNHALEYRYLHISMTFCLLRYNISNKFFELK